MSLAQAGTFIGADAIEEYVRFGIKDSSFFLGDTVETFSFRFTGCEVQKEHVNSCQLL